MSPITPSVAWLNLSHKPIRLILLLSGIVFAVILMFMFTGFKNALYDSQLQLIDRLKGDIFIVNQRRVSLGIPMQIRRQVLYQAQGYEGVKSASALYMGEAFWKNPETKLVRLTRVLAFNPEIPLFDFPELQDVAELRLPNTAWVDRLARPELGSIKTGTVTELSDRRIKVVGNFTLGNDFASLNGNLLMSEANFQRYFSGRDPKEGNRTLNEIDMAVIETDPQFSTARIASVLQQQLPKNLRIMTRDQIKVWERKYWQESTNIGFVFGILTIMGFVIGVILCYQIIYADVNDNLRQYSTLKAMGYRNIFLYTVIFQEALLLGILGFIPGIVLSYGLYEIAKVATGLVFQMTFDRSIQLLGFTIIMCFLSGLAALFKVQQSDPADIF
ncbi:MAG: ABC transporter permease DevC [Thermosynechococcaceae cyanobacterium MS004]|nr:ABC transporter permease DevC [Thermosynechococcaceae cyanobacterium MS004]